MLPNSFRSISVFFRVSNSFSASCQSLFKYYHKRPEKTIRKCYSHWKSGKGKTNCKTIGLSTAVGFGVYACSAISKTSDPFPGEETEDEFDELFTHENLKEDIELLKKFGPVPFLLIGAGPASIAALHAIRSKVPTAKVLMISEEMFEPYRRPPLSKELWLRKDLDPATRRRLVFYDYYYFSVQEMLENKNGGIALMQGKKVVKIDPISQVVVLDSGEQIAYEKCLLDMGTKPKNLPVFEEVGKRINNHMTLFHSIDDFVKLEKISGQVKSIAVIGGGFLGSELASGLYEYNKSTGLNVVQIFHEPGHLSNFLPQYLSKCVTERYQKEGIHVVPGVSVKAVNRIDNKVELHLSNDEIISVDHVVVAVGEEPNTDIALSSGLETDNKNGGFLVNAEMKARKNLWIAGNASSFYDTKLGRRRIEYYNDALHSGYLAAENMTGNEKPYANQIYWSAILTPSIFCEGVGDTDPKLETIGIFSLSSASNAIESVISEETNNTILKTEEQVNITEECIKCHIPSESDSFNYRKGVIFYLRENIIVGVLQWNTFADTKLAVKIIKGSKSRDDAIECAKLFEIVPVQSKVDDNAESHSV